MLNSDVRNIETVYTQSVNLNLNKTKKMLNINWGLKTKISIWLIILIVICAFGTGVLAGGANFFSPENDKDVIKGAIISTSTSVTSTGIILNSEGKVPDYLTKDVDFKLFWEVWNILKANYYVKDVPDTQIFYGALAGMVQSLNDSYSVFMTPQDNTAFQLDLQGNFEGVGAEIALKNNLITVVSPLADSPAIKSGLKPNDVIMEINGTSTQGMRVDQAVSLIRGPKGTQVTLTIFREGLQEPLKITVTRENIVVKSLTMEFKGDLAYIKVRQFNDDTIPFLEQSINQINSRNTKGIILDLRNNPGGYLQTAVDMVGEWVGNKIAVLERHSNGTEIKHLSTFSEKLSHLPTVILIDGGSASASEIVAGALQDYEKATLIGEKTFGKGSVQDLIGLSNGSAVKITVAKWFTPKGRSIDQEGIQPDISVELTDEDFNNNKDPQLDKAIEFLNR